MNPFDFLTSASYTKKYIMTEDNENEYKPFLVNRSLSYFKDSVLLANEMNRFHELDNKLQYDFFINTLRKQKRFSKWQKAQSSDIISAIKFYYGYNDEKASQALRILSDDQKQSILKKVSKGGTKHN